MRRLTPDGTAEPVSRTGWLHPSRETKFSGANGDGNVNFPCSADHEQAPICSDYTAIQYICMCGHHL